MNIQIRLTSNGNYSPNVEFDLGNKYESVGDTMEFILPDAYKNPTHHYYLAFKMKKLPTFIFPVVDYKFTITRTITEYPGVYDIIFLITKNEIINGKIDEAVKLYVSSTMHGRVKDNFLTDPITKEVSDKNIELYYNKLDALADQLKYNDENNIYKGDYYKPSVDEVGVLSWEIKQGPASEITQSRSIRGPQGIQGGYYQPSEENGTIKWNASQDDLPEVSDINLLPYVENASNTYLDSHLKNEVSAAVDAKFKFIWDDENQILYIYTEDYQNEGE